MPVPLSQLQYARKYPFSSTAKTVVKQLAPDISQIDEKAFERASDFILAASLPSPAIRKAFIAAHVKRRELSYEELLAHDVLAIPLAKIILSCIRSPPLYEKFASLVADLTFEYLMSEEKKISALVELSQDLKLKIDVENDEVRIPISQYLAFSLHDAPLHLVNRSVDKGKVELDTNAASRWLAEVVHASTRAQLPMNVNGLPPICEKMAARVELRVREAQSLAVKATSLGNVNVASFPPCMEKLYSEISSGTNIPHMARFDLATFLVNIHMPFEDIVSVFAKASNYDEKITRYHLDNLSGKTGKKYSAPSCSKVREHGLCISRTCNVLHPLQFYRREQENASTLGKKDAAEKPTPSAAESPAS